MFNSLIDLLIRLFWMVAAGVAIGLFATIVPDLPPKFFKVIMLGVLGAPPALALLLFVSRRTQFHTIALLLFAYVMAVPFYLGLSLFYRDYVGIPSVDVSVSLLAALGIFSFQFADYSIVKFSAFRFHIDKLLLSAMLTYIFTGILSMVGADHVDLCVLELATLGIMVFYFVVISNLQNRDLLRVLLYGMGVGAMLQCLMGLYQYSTGNPVGLYMFGEMPYETLDIGFRANRATGTFGHPNPFAYYMEMHSPLMFAMFLVERNWKGKLFFLCAFFACIIGMFTSLSRTSWLTVPWTLLIVFLVLKRGKRLFDLRTPIGIMAGLIVGLIVLSILFPTIKTRFTANDHGSKDSRGPVNKAALSVIRQFPVLGVGLNNMAAVFKKYDTTGHTNIQQGNHVVHNLWLLVWTEVGTVGLIAFINLFLSTFFKTFVLIFRLKIPDWDAGVAVGAATSMAAQGFHGFMDPGFKIFLRTDTLFFTLMALVGAISVLQQIEGGAARGDRARPALYGRGPSAFGRARGRGGK